MNSAAQRAPGTIKVLMLAPFFNQEGTSNRPCLISDVLARFGTVDIVTTSFDHQTKQEKSLFQFNDNRTIHYLPTVPYKRNISMVRFISHFIFSIRVLFFFLPRKNNYNVVYATLPLNLMSLLVFIRSPKILRIADVVDIWPDVLPFPVVVRKVFFPFFTLWKKSFVLAVRQCDVLLSVSDRFMDESLPYFRHGPSVAHRFYIGAKRLPGKKKSSDGLLTIAYVGNIGRLYDFTTLLMSMNAFKDKLRFFIVGDGDRRNWLLSELVRLNIEHRYFGVVYEDDALAEILSNCDLGFNGYLNTTASFSYKANTYFSAGLPILNSMGGDLKDLVSTHGLGFNYAPGNVGSLQACIERCLSEDMSELSRNVDTFFMSELDQAIIKDKIEKFINNILQNKFVESTAAKQPVNKNI